MKNKYILNSLIYNVPYCNPIFMVDFHYKNTKSETLHTYIN